MLLVGYVGVPSYRVGTLLEEISGSCIVGTPVHKMNFWVTFWTTGSGVDVMATKVSSKVQCLFNGKVGKVLVPESFQRVRCGSQKEQ